jgi:hypothetical protein
MINAVPSEFAGVGPCATHSNIGEDFIQLERLDNTRKNWQNKSGKPTLREIPI